MLEEGGELKNWMLEQPVKSNASLSLKHPVLPKGVWLSLLFSYLNNLLENLGFFPSKKRGFFL